MVHILSITESSKTATIGFGTNIEMICEENTGWYFAKHF